MVASSRSMISACPRYVIDIGPTFTRTWTLNAFSPVLSVTSAPGMQGATRSKSIMTFHASAGATGTMKLFSKFIPGSPDRPANRAAAPTPRSRGHLVDPTTRVRQPAALMTMARGDHLREHGQRRLPRRHAAQVQSQRRRESRKLVLAESHCQQPLAPALLGAAGPHRADESGR